MKLSVAQKLGLLTITALMGIILLAGLSKNLIDRVYDGANFSNVVTQPSIVILDQTRNDFTNARMYISREAIFNLLKDKAQAAKSDVRFQAARHALLADFDRYQNDGCLGRSCIINAKDRTYLQQERQKWLQLDAHYQSFQNEIGIMSPQKAQLLLGDTAPEAEEIAQLLSEHVALNVQLGASATAVAAGIKSESMRLSLYLATLTLVLVGLICAVVSRIILRQLGGEPADVASLAGSLALGNLGMNVAVKDGDERSLMASMKALVETMRRIAGHADAVGKGDFSNDVQLLSEHDQLGHALNNMTGMLRAAKLANERHNWLQQGTAQLSAALTGDYPLQYVGEIAIGTLGRYLSAGRGVLYLHRPEEKALDLLGSYMYTEPASLSHRFKEGEGAIGQVARERKPIFLTMPGGDAAPIVTGTVRATPLYTYTYPLIHENDLLGVVELASFEAFTDRRLEFCEAAADLIASFLFIAVQRQSIQELLTISESAEREVREHNERLQLINSKIELQNQQLQQQSEELQQTNAQMEEQQQQLQQQSEELQQTNAQMEEQALQLQQNNTELHRTQSEVNAKAKQLEISNRYKSEFLANMSHELRTPLNAIILLSKMMADNREGRLAPEDVKRADVVHRSGEDLLGLINDVLDLSKVEAGRMDVNLTEIASDQVAQDLHDLFDSTAQLHGLEFPIEDRLCGHFACDQDKLYQILRNLLSNAFKFTKAGHVSLTMERLKGEALPIRFAVRDTGVGIAADRQQFIFEAFRQVDGSIAREYGGTGLGLTISLRLAELLGGSILVHSAPGEGSEFCLCLPERVLASGAEPSLGRKPASTPGIVAPLKSAVQDDRIHLRAKDQVILLIDDDPDFGAIVLDINRRLGLKTLLAGSAAEGLKLLHTYRPAGILLDLGLPDMDGKDLLHKIKSSSELASIPVYVISAQDREAVRGQHDIVGYLQKPVDEEQIAKAEALLLSSGALAADGNILVVASGGVDAGTITGLFSFQLRLATVRQVAAAEFTGVLAEQAWQLVVVDLTGISIREALDMAEVARSAKAALLFFSLHPIGEEDEARLRRFSDSIIVKTPMAGKRLLLEMERFLRQVPEVAKTADSSPQQPEGSCQLDGKKILVVDDDPRNLFVITSALEQSGARVVNAVNGQKALEFLKAETFDLMFTDVMMPVMDGYELIEKVRANPKMAHLPIITLTAKAMSHDRESALAVGSSDFLSKPVDYDVLVNLAALWCTKGE